MSSNKVKVYPVNSVTQVDATRECDPRDVGMTQRDVDAIWKAVEAFYATGLQPAMQLCIRRQGKIVLNRAIGHTHGNEPHNPPGAPKTMTTPQSLFNLFSASKAITAMVIHHLDENRLLHLEDPLAMYMREFEQGSKRFITVRHVLLHQAGVPGIPQEAFDLDNLHIPGALRAAFYDAPMQWRAGAGQGYHALTGGFILGELVEAITGMTIRAYLAKHFLQPMQMQTFNFGVAEARAPEVAPHVYTGYPFPTLMEKAYWMRILGVSYGDAIDMSNDRRFITGIIPAANVIGTAEETSRFYEMLLRDGEYDGTRILKPETVRRATAEQTDRFDRILGMRMRYSLGFMLGRKRFSLYGNDTAKAFGHLGFVNVLGYADPERDMSVGFLNNGKPGMSTGMLKFMQVLNAIAKHVPKDAG